jgi:hypothetical protein
MELFYGEIDRETYFKNIKIKMHKEIWEIPEIEFTQKDPSDLAQKISQENVDWGDFTYPLSQMCIFRFQ